MGIISTKLHKGTCYPVAYAVLSNALKPNMSARELAILKKIIQSAFRSITRWAKFAL